MHIKARVDAPGALNHIIVRGIERVKNRVIFPDHMHKFYRRSVLNDVKYM